MPSTLKYAFRRLAKTPGIVAVVIATFAVGTGANVTMFAMVDRLLLSPPAHVTQPDYVKRVLLQHGGATTRFAPVFSYPDYLDISKAQLFTQTAAVNEGWTVSVGRGAAIKRSHVGLVTANFFDLLGTRPRIGRFFQTDDDQSGAAVVVLSYHTWAEEYGRDPNVLGRQIEFGYGPYVVIGVAPSGFTGADLRPIDMWLPLRKAASQMMGQFWSSSRGLNWLEVFARLGPSALVASAEGQATAILRASHAVLPDHQSEQSASVLLTPLIAARGPLASNDVKVVEWLGALSLLVLLIACANVANIMMARSMSDRQQVVIKLALGSRVWRLVAQPLVECVLLAIVGGLVGLGLATWGGSVLRDALMPGVDWSETGGNALIRLGWYLAIVALLSGLLSGLVPAIQLRTRDIMTVLRSAARTTVGVVSRTQDALAVLQVSLSVILLIGAGLFIRSLHRVESLDLGMKPDGVLAVVPTFDRGTPERRVTQVLRDARDALSRIPGVQAVSLDFGAPFQTSLSTYLRVPGLDSLPKLETGDPVMHGVDPGYFDAMGETITRGRGFTSADNAQGAARVVLVNETMARLLWPTRDAVGQCLVIDTTAAGLQPGRCATVVGVTKDARSMSVIEGETMQYFFPEEQDLVEDPLACVIARVSGRPDEVAPSIRQRIQALGSDVRFVDIMSLRNLIEPGTRSWRLGAAAFTALGISAALLAAIGLFGLLAFNVAQRSAEFGVRAVLGAAPKDLQLLAVKRALLVVGVGLALGMAIVGAFGNKFADLLYRVRPLDLVTLAIVTGALLLIGIAASLVPARRAAMIDPASAMRSE